VTASLLLNPEIDVARPPDSAGVAFLL